jgi:hypothetical protein
MKTETLVIENPSDSLLEFVRNLREKKELEREEIRKNWNIYFPKK